VAQQKARQAHRQGRRSEAGKHEGFLRHANFRWLKVAVVLCLIAIAGYFLIDVQPRPSGGTAYGYTLGTISALLIVWLSLIGIRKRAMTSGNWSLKAWLSAHVYLGLALTVLATLHTGLKFGWNVHTLTYGLMLLVIVSGIFGVIAYATLPIKLSENRGETTQKQMLESIKSLDRQLLDAAQPLNQEQAAIVRLSLERTDIAGGFWARLTGFHPGCGTRRAIARLAGLRRRITPGADGRTLDQIGALLERKYETVEKARRHIRIRAILEVWLKIHVPTTFVLLAALTAHIVSVFFYW
jgi:hypothetical protein